MNGSSVRVKHGSEGPKHDPYHVTEYLITRASGDHGSLRMGMGVSLNINGRTINEDSEKKLIERFEKLCGVSMHVLEKTIEGALARKIRQHPCGSKHMHNCDGYPGESFLVCHRCGDVIDSQFNRAAIE